MRTNQCIAWNGSTLTLVPYPAEDDGRYFTVSYAHGTASNRFVAAGPAGSRSQTPGVHGSGIVAGLISQYPRNKPRARNDTRSIIPIDWTFV